MSNYYQSGSTQGADGKWYTPKQVADFALYRQQSEEREQAKRWHYQSQIDACRLNQNDQKSLATSEMKYNSYKH